MFAVIVCHGTHDMVVHRKIEEDNAMLNPRSACLWTLLAVGASALLLGCDPNASGACDDIKRAKSAVDARLVTATKAGLAEARMRKIPNLPADSEVPSNPYLPSGELHPLVKKWAFDGDKKLRGKGPSMGALTSELEAAKERGKDCPEAK